jgi:hypothetical protein
VVLRGNNLEIKLGVGFLIKPPLKSSSNHKMLSSFKRGAIYLLKSTQILKPLVCVFWETLQFEAPTFAHGFTPTNTYPTKYRCLGYVAYECHANFQIN